MQEWTVITVNNKSVVGNKNPTNKIVKSTLEHDRVDYLHAGWWRTFADVSQLSHLRSHSAEVIKIFLSVSNGVDIDIGLNVWDWSQTKHLFTPRIL